MKHFCFFHLHFLYEIIYEIILLNLLYNNNNNNNALFEFGFTETFNVKYFLYFNIN